MSARRTARGFAVAAILLPLSGAGLLLSAEPAQAATGITAPSNGVDYTSDTTVHMTATVDRNTGSASLRVQSPTSSSPETVDTASTSLTAGASLSYDFDTATCASFPNSCSGRAEAPNGEWTVTLVSGGTVVDTRAFTLRIAPRAPRGLSAQPDGYRAVVLNWTKGEEPDLTGWTVWADSSPSQDVGTSACSGSTCTTTVTYAEDGTGQHRYVLIAHRRVAPDSPDTIDSTESAEVTATLDSPPPPSPAPADPGSQPSGGSTGDSTTGGDPTGGSTSGGDTSAGGGSSSTGGSSTSDGSTGSGTSTGGTTGRTSAIAGGKAPATLAQRRAFALTFKAFAPKLGIPKLPPLPAAQGPSVAPLPDGTYEQTLGYKDVLKTEKVNSPQAAARRVTRVVSSALDSDQFLRFMAAALVLLLLAAHARRWVASHNED
ncbi:MAG: hypothetical protein QOJ79_2048 [Actinomycetota bacterium]|jgi:hypothetical protein|nr:hypothetical protein [Actinomycetota bacterium]